MGCCNEPATALAAVTTDPTQHVNFAKGMVLGVDDFTQEFAYLAGRAEWLAREAVGYGTTSGLRVWAEDDGANGPRLHVGAGSAIVPSGKLVCVPADQCAVMNRWLAKRDNAALVTRLLSPDGSPPLPLTSPPFVTSPPAVTQGPVALYLVLCFRDCPTRPVPIPGEPCRTSDQLMENSRVADDFRLELRGAPPKQVEEDALRDFVRWLRRNITVDGGGSPTTDHAAWLEALRAAARPWLDAATLSPPVSPPASFETLGDYLFDASPAGVSVAPEQLGELLRAAFRFWVTELRPLWMARRCHQPMFADDDCVLLARVELDVVWIGGSPTGAWEVSGGASTMTLDERTRPVLVHARLADEWTLGIGDAAGAAPQAPMAPPMAFPPGGSLFVPVRTTSANVTLGPSDYLLVGTGAPSITVTLPVADPTLVGRVYVVRNVGVTTLTLKAQGSDKVDGVPSALVKAGKTTAVVAGAAGQWYIIAKT